MNKESQFYQVLVKIENGISQCFPTLALTLNSGSLKAESRQTAALLGVQQNQTMPQIDLASGFFFNHSLLDAFAQNRLTLCPSRIQVPNQ